MKRLFEQHVTRKTLSLDGFWDFADDPNRHGRTECWQKAFPSRTRRMPVPGCWDSVPSLFDYRGQAYYRREIRVPSPCNLLLTFEGVSGVAEVFFDGRRLARHSGTFGPFTALARNVKSGLHTVVVRVDNDHAGLKVFPQYPCDWFHYGGIVRPVEAAFLGDAWIEHVRVRYRIRGKRVLLEPEIVVSNLARSTTTGDLVIEINGTEVDRTSLSLARSETRLVTRRLPGTALPLWSPDAPNLHTIRVSYRGDDLIERTGFRSLTTSRGKLLLNGDPIRLLGINRHHEYGEFGFAIPPAKVQRDFEIIRDLGCNAVRCHYPIDALAMDFCDEMGLLFWSEIPFYGRWPAVVDHVGYLALAEQAIESMVLRDINRPSVFCWSVLNECATDLKKGARAAACLVNKVRSLDSSRPVSYASNRLWNDKGFQLLDIVALNAYPGWYTDKKRPEWPEIINRVRKALRAKGAGPKPILVTETGAGAIVGDRGFEHRKWSENTQLRIIKKNLETLLADKRVSGVFLWQFADIRTADAYFAGRPGTFNNKGIVDRFRRPKEAYWTVREIYRTYRQPPA